MKLSPEAEAEIERLTDRDEFGPWAADLIRTAMRWAYNDAAAVCLLHAREPQVMLATKITDDPRSVVCQECAAAIEERAKL